jgi:hypothetical protein
MDKKDKLKCTYERANKLSIAHLLGIQNDFGKAVLGNSFADGIELIDSVINDDELGVAGSASSIAADRGTEQLAGKAIQQVAPGTTEVAISYSAAGVATENMLYVHENLALRSSVSTIISYYAIRGAHSVEKRLGWRDCSRSVRELPIYVMQEIMWRGVLSNDE